jgi:hypothetical protein
MSSDRSSMALPYRPAAWTMGGLGAVALLGLAGWGLCVLVDPGRAWRAMLVNFVYFAPLSAGMVVWSAIVALCNGRWARSVQRWSLAAAGFAPVSLAMLAALWFGREHWAGWHHHMLPNQGFWLDDAFLFARDAAALVIVWGLAAALLFRRRAGGEGKALSAMLALAYGLGFSLLGFDLVMSLEPRWYSTLMGGYFFVSGLYAAVAAWTLVSLVHQPVDVGVRHDLGKLLVAMSLLTTYLMYSQLLPIWYGNLPREAMFVIPRLGEPPWMYVSALLLATIYLGPLAVLLTTGSKRSPKCLGVVSAAVLAGLWVERWWLVTPTLGGQMRLGLAELSLTLGCAALFALCLKWTARTWPVDQPGKEISPE